MISKVALELLESAGTNLVSPYEERVLRVFRELVERDTPKKPYEKGYYYCPNCDNHYLHRYVSYCDSCGQRLDWSRDDE